MVKDKDHGEVVFLDSGGRCRGRWTIGPTDGYKTLYKRDFTISHSIRINVLIVWSSLKMDWKSVGAGDAKYGTSVMNTMSTEKVKLATPTSVKQRQRTTTKHPK